MDPSWFCTSANPENLLNIPFPEPFSESFEGFPEIVEEESSLIESFGFLLDLDEETFASCRKAALLETHIDSSIFRLPGAMKCANLDAVFALTRRPLSFTNEKSLNRPAFCDLGAGPGGFSEYLQWRFPTCMIFGATLSSETQNWDLQAVVPSRSIRFTNSEGSGDLRIIWQEFINFGTSQFVDGIPCIFSDLAVDESRAEVLFGNEEKLAPLLRIACTIALALVSAGGSFVLRCNGFESSETRNCLFLLSQAFTKVYLFKPATSSPEIRECYFVALEACADLSPFRSALQKDTLPPASEAFNFWCSEHQKLFQESQREALERISAQARGQPIPSPQIWPHLLNTLWNVPSAH